MIKIFEFMVIILVLTLSVSGMYGGESYSFELDTVEPIIWQVEGNSSSLEGFSVSQQILEDYSIITFSTEINMKPDEFEVIIISNKTQKPISHRHYSKSKTKPINQTNITIPEVSNNTCIDSCGFINETNQTEYIDNRPNYDILPVFLCFLFPILIFLYLWFNRKRDESGPIEGLEAPFKEKF